MDLQRPSDMASQLVILPGSASIALGTEICNYLSVPCGQVEVKKFKDHETFVKVLDNVRGKDVYVVQSTSSPANETLMELLLIIDAVRRASAHTITVVVPYFGYARQDRKEQGRVALSAKLVSNMITVAGADRVLTMDLHSGQIQGFFDIPVDNLVAATVLVDYVRSLDLGDFTVVSPDLGNVKMARNLAETLAVPLAIVDKRRPTPNTSEVISIIGEQLIRDKTVLLFDDLIDTAGTICNAARALRDRGARDVYALATHGVFSGEAISRLNEAPIRQVIVTNTIPRSPGELPEKVKVLTIAPLIAQAIERIHNHRSVSDLFRGKMGDKSGIR